MMNNMFLQLNTISPSKKSKYTRKRVGRGIGSGLGKTGGRGHKGQKSRSGCKIRIGFEGGQTSLCRRLPKFGFRSNKCEMTEEVPLYKLSNIVENVIDLNILKKNRLVRNKTKFVKIIMSGKINRAFIIRNLGISQGARVAIQELGGKIT